MDLNKKLKKFLNKDVQKTEYDLEEDEILTPKNGLVERVDKVLKIQDGRQLLKEQRFESTSTNR